MRIDVLCYQVMASIVYVVLLFIPASVGNWDVPTWGYLLAAFIGSASQSYRVASLGNTRG